MSWYPRSCPACNGDLYDDALEQGDVTCMMCARSFRAADVIAVQRIRRAQQPQPAQMPKAA